MVPIRDLSPPAASPGGACLPASPAGAPSIARHPPARNRRRLAQLVAPRLEAALPMLAVLAALALAGCVTQPRGLVPVAGPGHVGAAGWPEGPPPSPWMDDGDAASLQAALTRSEQYFAALPPDAASAFGTLRYSPQEMIQSLELFRSLLRDSPDPRALREQVWEKFHVFASVAASARNLFTGYYEPVIPGSPTATARFDTPLYARPPDLVQLSLGDFGADLPRRNLVGRVREGRLVPYYSRQEIQGQDALKDSAQPLAYVNEVDLFFLQIQGSGQVLLPDGGVLHVGYDGSNGQPYRSLGAELVRRGLMPREQVSLQSLRQYLAAHPEQARGLLYTNPSYVFFRRTGEQPGPTGSLGVPLTPGRSIAADAAQLPPGALAYVQTTVPVPGQAGATRELHRFMLIQDTGGAIQGHGRVDIFWGSGPDAEWMAGYANAPGRLYLLVAKKEALPPPASRTAAGPPAPSSAAQAAPGTAPSPTPNGGSAARAGGTGAGGTGAGGTADVPPPSAAPPAGASPAPAGSRAALPPAATQAALRP